MIPIAFPKAKPPKKPKSVLAADVGGTKTNLALFHWDGEKLEFSRQESFKSNEYPSFVDIVKSFHLGKQLPDRICIGFAGPIIRGEASGTNLIWGISTARVASDLGIKHVTIINDLEANSYGIVALKPEEVLILNEGDPEIEGNVAVLSPGTGLGEAGMYWDGEKLHPFATEGGHSAFSSYSDIDVELYIYLREKFGHVSWERVLSGQGICSIYNFMKEVRNLEEPSWMKKKMLEYDPASVITEGAQRGVYISIATYRLFFRCLAEEAANLTLKMKATGGLFIGGGIIIKVLELLDKKSFLNHLFNSGRLKPLLEKVPIYVILNDKTALWGAAHYGLYS